MTMDMPKHLKRIKRIKEQDKTLALLCPENALTDEFRMKLEEIVGELVIEHVEIPMTKAICKRQFDAWRTLWPMDFHCHRDESYVSSHLIRIDQAVVIFS